MHLFKGLYFNASLLLLLALANFQCTHSKKTATTKTSKTAKNNSVDPSKFTYYFIEGCKERMKGNFELAEKSFTECFKIDPNSAAVMFEIATIKKYKGQHEIALRYSKDCALQDPKNEWYQLLYIECLHNTKQYSQAADVYIKLVKNYPNRAEFYEGLAAEYMYAQNFEKSFKIYEELETKFGQNEAFTLNKIKILKTLNKKSEAEIELKKLIKSNPSEIKYYNYLAEFYIETEQNEKVLIVYHDALKVEPNNPMIHLALADYYKVINDKENFYKEIKIAFKNPDLDIETKQKILGSYFELSEQNSIYQKEANELCEIMLRMHPNASESHSLKADFLFRDKKIKEAQGEYEIAVQLDKGKFGNWNQLMYIDSELNENKKLEEHSSEAMELFPNQPTPFFFNGIANIQLKNYQKAVESLNEGIEFVYKDNLLLTQFYYNFGDAYNYLKEYEKSDKAFDDALKIDPDNSVVLNNYAYYLSIRKDKLDKAEKYSRRSNEISQNNRSYIDTYGWILYQLGKNAEAEIWLARAVKMGAKNAVILEHYGDVLFKLNKITDAVNYWKEAKLSGGNSEILDKKITDKKLYE